MNIRDIHALQTVWVVLGEDDMYGADSGTDNVIQARVSHVNEAHQDVEVDGLEDDCEYIVEPEQCHATESDARAAAASDFV